MNRNIFKLMAMLFVALAGAGFTACSDDDDDPEPAPEAKASIVGMWQSEETKYWDEDSDGPFDQTAWEAMPMGKHDGLRMEFTADGKVEQWFYFNGGWSHYAYTGTYVMNAAGTAFELTSINEPQLYEIVSMTDEELTLFTRSADTVHGQTVYLYEMIRFRRIPTDTPMPPGVA